VAAGVSLAADDFLREIQGLSAHFDVLRIDGEDYRHRGLPDAPEPLSDEEVARRALTSPDAAVDDFATLLRHLSTVHPSKYGALPEGVPLLGPTTVRTVSDQASALCLVVLVGRLFADHLLRGGYRKKYFRAVSRLVALARDGQAMVG
jgi:cell division protein ZapE